MKIPKIEFNVMSLEENIDIIKWTYYENNDLLDVYNYVIEYFPELANIDKNLPRDEVYKIIEGVVEKDYNKYKNRIEEEVKRYSFLWEKYNDLYFRTLSNYLEIDWPINIEIIECNVGLIPVFPRDLDSFSFSISTGVEESKLIGVCAHETLHFLWFEKWKRIHPETPRIEFDSPYTVWQYSEMVTDPILNNKPFCDIFNFKEYGYDSFYEIYDGEALIMDNLRNIYSKDIPIDDKINKGFNYVVGVLEGENGRNV